MKFFGIEKLSMVDFENHLCSTLFTAGCNFRCPYCHNSDLVNLTNINEIKEEDIFNYLNKRKGIIDSVCISGGEPTLNKDLPKFIKKLKDLNYLVKLDTNGTDPEMLKFLIENKLIDYVAMDIKNSKNLYFDTCNASPESLKNVILSVDILKQNKIPYEFRTTLIAQKHSLQSITEMANWLSGAQALYLQCFQDKGTNLFDGLSAVNKEDAQKFKEILQKTIKKVELRGY